MVVEGYAGEVAAPLVLVLMNLKEKDGEQEAMGGGCMGADDSWIFDGGHGICMAASWKR